MWAYCGIAALYKIGLVGLIFGMEYAAGWDRALAFMPGHVRDYDPLILFCMQMQSPDDLVKFKTRLDEHFSQYYRCAYNVTRIRSSVFFQNYLG